MPESKKNFFSKKIFVFCTKYILFAEKNIFIQNKNFFSEKNFLYRKYRKYICVTNEKINLSELYNHSAKKKKKKKN